MAKTETQHALTKVQEKAALMVAKDEKSDEQIADACEVGRRTLARWKELPTFAARVQEHRAAWRAEIKAVGIADRKARVAALEDRWQRMQRVIAERAADPEMKDVPGGKTGLLAVTYKQLGGKDGQVVREVEVDTGLLREMREHEKQAAVELGQLPATDKSEDQGVSLEEVLTLYRRCREVTEAGQTPNGSRSRQ